MRYHKLNALATNLSGNREPRGSQSHLPAVPRVTGRRTHQGHSISNIEKSHPPFHRESLINTETERSLKSRSILRRRKWVFPVAAAAASLPCDDPRRNATCGTGRTSTITHLHQRVHVGNTVLQSTSNTPRVGSRIHGPCIERRL